MKPQIAVDVVLAVAAAALLAFHVGPADRFIVATALARGATVVTADQADLGPKAGTGLPAKADAAAAGR